MANHIMDFLDRTTWYSRRLHAYDDILGICENFERVNDSSYLLLAIKLRNIMILRGIEPSESFNVPEPYYNLIRRQFRRIFKNLIRLNNYATDPLVRVDLLQMIDLTAFELRSGNETRNDFAVLPETDAGYANASETTPTSATLASTEQEMFMLLIALMDHYRNEKVWDSVHVRRIEFTYWWVSFLVPLIIAVIITVA